MHTCPVSVNYVASRGMTDEQIDALIAAIATAEHNLGVSIDNTARWVCAILLGAAIAGIIIMGMR
jgi:hypothetical protein